MENAKKLLIRSLKKAVKDITRQEVTPDLFHPTDEKHGDYSTNIAMSLFSNKELKIKNYGWKNPLELAQKIIDQFMIHNSTQRPRFGQEFMIISQVEVAKPGFINFWLSKDYLIALMIKIIKFKDEYGGSLKLKNKKVMVEFTDPNPFKEFHIGHLYSNTVGECLARLMETQGAVVKRANYQGDVGLHVAKALYALLNSKLNPRFNRGQNSKLEARTLKDKIKFLGEAYALGTRAYEEDKDAINEIEKISRQIYEHDPAIMPLYKKARLWSLEHFETLYKRLGTKFDYYYFESEVAEVGLNLVRKYLKKGVFEKSGGAVIFRGEKYGLHNRVFINSLGLPTYETKDLGLAPIKYKDFRYDLSVIVTASEQSDYFKVVLIALSKIAPELAEKTRHIPHGIVRLPIGKMSSRTGNVITGEWLLDETKSIIQKAYSEMDKDTAEKVAVGAVKYALLRGGVGRDIAFNFEQSINLEGNSGPYLQYTYARTQSVLAKLKTQNSKLKTQIQSSKLTAVKQFTTYKLQLEELSLLRALYRLPEIVGESAEKLAPNLLCNYLFDLAQKFNLFYQKVPILNPQVSIGTHPKGGQQKGGQSDLKVFRLALTMAVGQVIKNGLYLLGIKCPARM